MDATHRKDVIDIPYSSNKSLQRLLNFETVRCAAFGGAALIRGEALIRGRRLFQCEYLKVRRLFEARRLLEEIRYTTHRHDEVSDVVLMSYGCIDIEKNNPWYLLDKI